MEEIIEYARRFVGTHYVFGGNHPAEGLDCSGYVQIILRAAGVAPKGDLTAQMLHDYFLLNGMRSDPLPGALAFFGRSPEQVTHVAFMTSPEFLLEAGGGDHTTVDIMKAIKAGAFVRMRPFGHRKDLVGVLMPNYPESVVKRG